MTYALTRKIPVPDCSNLEITKALQDFRSPVRHHPFIEAGKSLTPLGDLSALPVR